MQQGESCIIFTTYHSLNKVVDAGIEINAAYFDESHNSVTRHFLLLLLHVLISLSVHTSSLLLLVSLANMVVP